jgi:predicted AlkP superfamily pyrophosphatase or phosphodiesterase
MGKSCGSGPWRSVLTAYLITGVFIVIGKQAAAQVPCAQYVVIIGIDGLSPDGIQKAATPYLHRLMKAGASTLHARAVMPTVSSPNWASMIMGAGPEQHGVTTNDWEPTKFEITPTAVGPGGMFPTIFSLLRTQRPSAQIGCFHDWEGFARLFEQKAADIVEHPNGPVKTTERAIAYLKEKRPDFTFIHLDHVDHAGHEDGHGTPQYYQAVMEADRLIGLILQGIKDAGIAEQTIVLVTADHGGKGKGHGGATMAEIEIPWIIAGPGITPGKEITAPVNTYDTAATVAYIFGLTPPRCWIARPVDEAFTKTTAATLPISPKSSR